MTSIHAQTRLTPALIVLTAACCALMPATRLAAAGLEFFQRRLLDRLADETKFRTAPHGDSARLIREMPVADLIEIMPKVTGQIQEYIARNIVERGTPDELQAELVRELAKRDLPLKVFFHAVYMALEHDAAVTLLSQFARVDNPSIRAGAIEALIRPAPAHAVVFLKNAFDDYPDAPNRALVRTLNSGITARDRAFVGLWLAVFKKHHRDLAWCRALVGVAVSAQLHSAILDIYDAYTDTPVASPDDFQFNWILANALGLAFSIRMTTIDSFAQERMTFARVIDTNAVRNEVASARAIDVKEFEMAQRVVEFLDTPKAAVPPEITADPVFQAVLAEERGEVPDAVIKAVPASLTDLPVRERMRLLSIVSHGRYAAVRPLFDRIKAETNRDIQYALCASLDGSLAAMNTVTRNEQAESLFQDFYDYVTKPKMAGMEIIVQIWQKAGAKLEGIELPALFAGSTPLVTPAVRIATFKRVLEILRLNDFKSSAPYRKILAMILSDDDPAVANPVTSLLGGYFRPPLKNNPNFRVLLGALVESLQNIGDRKEHIPKRIEILENSTGGDWFGTFASVKPGDLPPGYEFLMKKIQDWWKKNGKKNVLEWPVLHANRAPDDPKSDALKRFRAIVALYPISPADALDELHVIRPEYLPKFLGRMKGRNLQRGLRAAMDLYSKSPLFTAGLIETVMKKEFDDTDTLVDFLKNSSAPSACSILMGLAMIPDFKYNKNSELLLIASNRWPALSGQIAFMGNATGRIIPDFDIQTRALEPHLSVNDPLIHEGVARTLARDWRRASNDDYARGMLFCEIARHGRIMAAVPELVDAVQLAPVAVKPGAPEPIRNRFIRAAAIALSDLSRSNRLKKALHDGNGSVDAAAVRDWWNAFKITDPDTGAVTGYSWPWPMLNNFTPADMDNPDYYLAVSLQKTLADTSLAGNYSIKQYSRWWLGADPRLRWRGLRGMIEFGGGLREFGGDPLTVMESALSDTDPWVRMTAMFGLYRIGTPDAMSGLVGLAGRVPDSPWGHMAAGILSQWAFEQVSVRIPTVTPFQVRRAQASGAQFQLFWRRAREILFTAIQRAREESSKVTLMTAWMTSPTFDDAGELAAVRWVMTQGSLKLRGKFLIMMAKVIQDQENNLSVEFAELILPVFDSEPKTVEERKIRTMAEMLLIQVLGARTLRDELTVSLIDAAVKCLNEPVNENNVVILKELERIANRKWLPSDLSKVDRGMMQAAFKDARFWWAGFRNGEEVEHWRAVPAPRTLGDDSR